MDELLKPVSTVRRNHNEEDFLRELSVRDPSNSVKAKPKPPQISHPASPEDALEVLKNEPDYDSLVSVLRFLSGNGSQEAPGFAGIKLPNPLNVQIVQVLVSDIVPTYWMLLTEDKHEGKDSGLKLLLYCLSSITGINATLLRLSTLIQEAKSEVTDKEKRPDISLNLGVFLDLLCRLLRGDSWITEAWRAATAGQDSPARVKPRVQQILRTFGSGRIISVAAEAEEATKTGSLKTSDNIWLADPLQYTLWLGRNIVTWQSSDFATKEPKFASDLFIKARSLGHYGKMFIHVLSEQAFNVEQMPWSNRFYRS